MAPWQEIARQKQAQRDALIPREWRLNELPATNVLNVTNVPANSGILTPSEVSITEDYDAVALAELIRNRKVTSYAVTLAFCKRAAIAQQLTNCLTEICFSDALARAKALDYHLESHGEVVGPLHGIPISLKDGFKLPKFDATIGFAAFANKPAAFSSPLVSILRNAGAVFYCKTNIPQTLMAMDSENNVWGRTLNPLNRKVTAGGSSGKLDGFSYIHQMVTALKISEIIYELRMSSWEAVKFKVSDPRQTAETRSRRILTTAFRW